jgi:DNA-directed RNA polymerase subunit L
MEKIQNIDYSVKDYDKTYGNTRLELNVKGQNIDYVVMNTIRRSILSYIPNYAFTEFNFKKNDSIFNNNYLKLRIKNIPVWGIENNIETFVPKKKIIEKTIIEEPMMENNINDDIDTNYESTQLNTSTLNQLTMFVDYKSNEKDVISVTTDHAKFYYAEKQIESPYKHPIQLVKLQPNQTITFSVITTIGIEQQDSIYSVVSVCCYKEIIENEFEFIVESRGLLTEKRIIHVAIINIINKLKTIFENISNKIDNKKKKGEIVIINEDNTMGNLISHGMKQHKEIKFAGYNIPHLLEDRVIIHYELEDNGKLLNVLNDVTDYYIKLFDKIIEKNKII